MPHEEVHMNAVIDRTEWPAFLKSYGSRNAGRPTRLGVFETSDGVTDDYWLEDGLPLVGLDIAPKAGKTEVEIFLESFTHLIADATKLVSVEDEEKELGIDISDADGKTTVMRFENWPSRVENH
jgi:hypothetical protein